MCEFISFSFVAVIFPVSRKIPDTNGCKDESGFSGEKKTVKMQQMADDKERKNEKKPWKRWMVVFWPQNSSFSREKRLAF